MAWEQRGDRTYFYRSVRRGDRVSKEYYGGGDDGRLAAAVDAARCADLAAAEAARRALRAQVDAATALSAELARECATLTAAALLAAGFRRPGRHAWRRWRDGCRVLAQSR